MGVKLILFHPQLLQRTCASCQAWMYDDAHRPLVRDGRPLRRPAGSPTPCWQCPKQSPAHARGFERDLERICRTLSIYFEVQATAGRSLCEREAADGLLAHHLTIVDRIVRQWELARWRRVLTLAAR